MTGRGPAGGRRRRALEARVAALGAGGLLAALAGAGAGATACAGGAGRDSVPESRDVRVVDPGPGAAGAGGSAGYEYVARRPLAVVALAESRGLAPDVARQAVDRLADALDVCATERARRGAGAEGAARVVVPIDAGGAVGAPSVRVDPGAGVAESAVVCLVAPARLLAFPPADAGARGMAIEALWGRITPSPPAEGR